jgi:hypothetical protein
VENGVAEEHDPPHHAGQKDDTDQEQGEVTHVPNLAGRPEFRSAGAGADVTDDAHW